MADDIIINGLNANQPNAGNATGPANNGSTASATHSTGAQGASVSPKNKTEQSSVIDLRQLEPQKNDQAVMANSGKSTATSATAPHAAGAAQTANTSTATANSAKTSTNSSSGVSPALPNLTLEEAAMMEASELNPPDKYSVPPLVKEKFPDLIDLIKQTESMNNEERDYWFQILPIMTEEQIGKFRDILLNEKQQLAQLDKEYEKELNKLNEKHIVEWEEFKSKEKRAALTAKETKAEADEKAQEEELLKKLSQI